jgi:hypothetical protein
VDHRTHVSFALWPPLDFGLDAIASDAPVPSMTEYPDWLTARCGERERLRKFFTPTLRAVLADTPSLRDLGARVVLGDERFSVVCEDVVLPEQLRFLVKAAIDTANAIRAARPDVPVSYRLSPLVHEWDTIVRSRGFVRERTPVGLRRDLGNMHLRCFVRYRRRKRFVVASAEFTKRQRIGILASSGKFANSPIPWSMRDWSTSDLAFDAVFSVSALSQEHVERWLPDGVRRMLCEVARTWRDVVFDDYGVSIEVSLDDDEFPIEPLMDDAQRIVEELQASMPPSRQAYR